MITINQVRTELVISDRGDNDKRLSLKDIIDTDEVLEKKASKILGIRRDEIAELTILRHSIDARKKPKLFQVYTLGVKLKNDAIEEKTVKRCKNKDVSVSQDNNYIFKVSGENELDNRPVIVGMGPAGLFCAYMLSIYGYDPIILERGFDVETRTKDVEDFWNGGALNPDSNVQFGEGGAGTFSDGKLNTLIKDKRGRNREVLRIFAQCGAPDEILYDSKPHIGTDVLKNIVVKMRKTIIANGGSVKFGAKLTAVEVKDNKVCGITVNDNEKIKTSLLVLAIGHSARDTFEYLDKIKVPMEAKSFAVGMRIEHPQKMINKYVYGDAIGGKMPAASYKLTAKTDVGRGVYSFCMCPGGYVVNSSSEDKRLAVNGMSYADRNSPNANSAIIVQVSPDDYEGESALAGIEFQRRLEEKAYELGKGKVPVQYYGDYKNNCISIENKDCTKPCIKGEYSFTNLRGLLPDECEKAFIEGMEQFDRIIKGFADKGAVLSGIESRTSSPIRILRDDNLESPAVRGLYPCGEGAGYAGGITSAAMDGILVAEQIAAVYKPLNEKTLK